MKGHPNKFPRLQHLTLEERFAHYTGEQLPNGCIPWMGSVNSAGHGKIIHKPVHRYALERIGIQIPDGMQVDHVCHNQDLSCRGGKTCPHRRCINVEHLRITTNRENSIAGRASETHRLRALAKTSCVHGHPYTPENTRTKRTSTGGWQRICRTCARVQMRQARARMKEMGIVVAG